MTDENDDHEVGPPTEGAPQAPAPAESGRHANGRIRKGFTGNPKGRPKRPERALSNRQSIADILAEANAEVAVTRNGKTELVPMRRLIIQRLLLQAAKSVKLHEKIAALNFIDRAQSCWESRNWEFYEELEQVEKSFEEISALISDAGALEHRDKWRKKSRTL